MRKKKIMALVLAGTLVFGQAVFGQEVSASEIPETSEAAETVGTTELSETTETVETTEASGTEDTTDPVVTGFSMSVEPGTYVDEDDVVTFTVTAEDDVALDEERTSINLKSPLEGKNSKQVTLVYQGNGIYTGSVAAADLDACEWYVYYGYVYDKAGNYALVDNVTKDWRFEYPYYFYVEKDGECEQAFLEQLTINFHNADGELISSFVKENVPKRTTLGEILGEDYPVLEIDETLGAFKGWATYYIGTYKDLYTNDSPLLLEYNFYGAPVLNLYAAYENRYITVLYAYMLQDGTWEMYGDTVGDDKVLCRVGATYAEALEALPVPKDVQSKYHFQKWIDWAGGELEGTVGNYVEEDILAKAAYDQYPVEITKTYIDQNGEVKTVTETRDYPAGSRWENILAENETIPVDASAEYPITGWKIYDTKGEYRGGTTTEGEIGGIWWYGEVWANHFHLVAEYDDKALVGVDYDYVNQDALPFSQYYEILTKFVLCDTEEADSTDAIYEKALELAPEDHLEDLEFTGSWEISQKTGSDTTYYVMTADYNKVKVILSGVKDGKGHDAKVAAAEPGQVIDLPEGYEYTAYVYDQTTGEHTTITGTQYTVPSDAGDSVTVYCHKIDNTDDLVQQIEEADAGSVIETAISGTAEISGKVLEAMQGKEVTLNIALDDGVTWSINGKDLSERELSDMDLSVIRTEKAKGNISEETITSLAGERAAEQLIFAQEGVIGFNSQLKLGMNDGINAEKGVLVQNVDGVLQLSDSAMVTDGGVIFQISQGADSAVIYGTNGDTNGDDGVDIRDLMQTLYHVSGRTEMNEVQKGFADVDMNNLVNLQDLMRELYYVSGRNSSL